MATVQPSAIGQALLAVGDQWTLLILQRAFLRHTRRFAEWRDDLGVSESVLAGRLKLTSSRSVVWMRSSWPLTRPSFSRV